MMGTNPKVTVSSLASLVASVIATFVLVHWGVHLGDATTAVVTGLVTLVATYTAGYLKSCLTWAEQYVSAHKSSEAVYTQHVSVPATPATLSDSNENSNRDWA